MTTAFLTCLVNDSQKTLYGLSWQKYVKKYIHEKVKRYPEPNVNHSLIVKVIILFGCKNISMSTDYLHVSWIIWQEKLCLKQKILILYCTQKQVFYANTYCLLIFCFKSTSYRASILRVTLFWDAFVLCEEELSIYLLEYFWKLFKVSLPLVLPKFSHWLNYSAVQIPD